MKNQNNTQLAIKPYTTKELCTLYEVSPRILRNWLQPFQQELGTKTGHYYTIAQVEMIFDKLGAPGNYDIRQ